MSLTQRQQEILDYVRQFLRDNEYPPSIREIMDALHISSTSVVNYNLNALVRQGHITRNRELARGIRLVESPRLQRAFTSEMVRVPVLGRIIAGGPIPVPDSAFPQRHIDVPGEFLSETQDIYALEVTGESMIDALVNDGDLVILRRQAETRNGAMVAVWLKDEGATTLKHFYLEGDRVRLQPANPFMDPIYTPAANVEIQGKVITIIRQLERPKL
jgi:repressor LexA